MAQRFIDLTGMRFGRLTVLETVETNKHGNKVWRCLCDCGNTKIIVSQRIKEGITKSCGCLRSEKSSERRLVHGRSIRKNDPEYLAWCGMIARCTNPNDKNFKNYGGRNISVSDRWRHNFQAFLEDMGERPSPEYSIDRVDVNGDYEPSNCRWATKVEQARNRRARKENSTGIVGVTEDKKRKMWKAVINVDMKKLSLGHFNQLEEAVNARKAAEQKYWGREG